MSVFKEIDFNGGLSFSNRPINSAAKCWLSDALPPLPHQKILPLSFKTLVALLAKTSISDDSGLIKFLNQNVHLLYYLCFLNSLSKLINYVQYLNIIKLFDNLSKKNI